MKRKKTGVLILLLVLICLLSGGQLVYRVCSGSGAPLTMVIDAGHGGPDSGAVGSDGTVEREINLAIAKALMDEAQRYGIDVILTRETAEGLYSDGDTGGRWSKLGDLNERKRIIREAGADLVISIHLNSFTEDERVRGAQVFYPQEASKAFAEQMQESLKKGINDGTSRTALQKKDMYLFRNLTGKMILVECGFLSNPVDLGRLKTEEHQVKIANSMMNAVAAEYKIKIQKKPNSKVIDSRTTFQ